MKSIAIPLEVQTADVLFVSHSGGKDSQATLAALVRLGFKGRIVVVHSDLGEMEWEQMHPWIESISFGLEVHVVKAKETFFEMVRRLNRIPSGNMQFCTNILKVEPICEFIHDYLYTHNLKTGINVTGMRGGESKRRLNKEIFCKSENMHFPVKHSEHTIYDWLPIKEYSELEVFAEIASAGQEPHELYSMGFSRLSCVFCINGKVWEHQKAAELRPELALKIANLEREIGRTYRLKQINKVKYPKFMDTYIRALPPQFVGGC